MVVEEAVMLVVPPLLSTLFGQGANKLVPYLEEKLGLLGYLVGAKSVLKKLKKHERKFEDIIDDIKRKPSGSRVIQGWLDELEETAWEVADLISEMNYNKQQVSNSKNLLNNLLPNFDSTGLNRLVDLEKKLEKSLNEWSSRYKYQLRDGTTSSGLTTTRTLEIENYVFARENSEEKIIDWLTKNDDLSPSSSSGVPKIPVLLLFETSEAIAKAVFNNPKVKGHFRDRHWIGQPKEFKDHNRQWAILCRRSPGSPMDDDELWTGLQTALSSGRFLFVFNNGLNVLDKKWEKLFALIVGSGSGSKVIVRVTRSSFSNDCRHYLREIYQRLPSDLQSCFAYCALFPKCYSFEESKMARYWDAQGYVRDDSGSSCTANDYFHKLADKSLFNSSRDDRYAIDDLFHEVVKHIYRNKCVSNIHQEQIEGFLENPRGIYHLSFHDENVDSEKRNKVAEIPDLEKLKKKCPLSLLVVNEEAMAYSLREDIFEHLRRLRVLTLSKCKISKLPNSIGHLIHLLYLNLSRSTISDLPPTISKLYNLIAFDLDGCDDLKGLPKGVEKLMKLRHLNASAELISSIHNIGRMTSLQKLEPFSVKNTKGFKLEELEKMNELQELKISNLAVVEKEGETLAAKLQNKKHLVKLTLDWSGPGKNVSNEQHQHEEEVLKGLRPHKNLEELSIENNDGSNFAGWVDMLRNSKLTKVSLSKCRNWTSLPRFGLCPSLETLDIISMSSITKLGSEFSENGSGFPLLLTLSFSKMPNWKEWSDLSVQAFSMLQDLSIKECPALERITLSWTPPLVFEQRILPPGIAVDNIMQDLNNLKSLKLVESGIKSLALVSLKALQYLNVENCNQMDSIVFGYDLNLRTMLVKACNSLLHLLEVKTSVEGQPLEERCPTSLRTVRVVDCPKLKTLPLLGLKYLEELEVSKCSSLSAECMQFDGLDSLKKQSLECVNIKKFGLKSKNNALKELKLSKCEILEDVFIEKLISLERVEIDDCLSIKTVKINSLPKLAELKMTGTTPLQKLFIINCPSISNVSDDIFNSLSQRSVLRIQDCPLLETDLRRGGDLYNKSNHISDKRIGIVECALCCCNVRFYTDTISNMKISENHKKLMEKTPFHKFLGMRSSVPSSDMLLTDIIRCYDCFEEKNTFVIGGKRVVFSDEEVALLLGLPKKGRRLDLHSELDGKTKFEARYSPGKLDLSPVNLKRKLEELVNETDPSLEEDFCRMLILFMAATFLLPRTSTAPSRLSSSAASSRSSTAPRGMLRYIENIEHIKYGDWAAAIHSEIMKGVRQFNRNQINGHDGAAPGFTDLLVMWLYEHTQLRTSESPNALPRFQRWIHSVAETQDTRVNLATISEVITEIRSPDREELSSITRQPHDTFPPMLFDLKEILYHGEQATVKEEKCVEQAGVPTQKENSLQNGHDADLAESRQGAKVTPGENFIIREGKERAGAAVGNGGETSKEVYYRGKRSDSSQGSMEENDAAVSHAAEDNSFHLQYASFTDDDYMLDSASGEEDQITESPTVTR